MGKKENPDDLQAYVNLLVEHQDRLRAYIYTLIPGSQHVNDVVQNTNAVLWQKREKFEHGTNFLAWAFNIARYQVKHQHGRDKRDGRLVFSDQLLERIGESTPTDSPRNRLLDALDRCMAKLSDDQQNIIQARYTHGKSIEQHAKELERTSGSLRTSLHRIRDALKICVENTLSEQSK
jgi:RNA polymerase sigma-70 factor (ECF subfamily)